MKTKTVPLSLITVNKTISRPPINITTAGAAMITTAPTASASSYAARANAKLRPTIKDIVTIEDRLNDLFAANPALRRDMLNNCSWFKSQNKHIRTWADLRLPRGVMMSLGSLKIDTTQQRDVNFKHVLKIVSEFNRLVVQSLSVYPTILKEATEAAAAEYNEDEINIWDGQHTALALFIIARYCLQIENLDEVMVPITMYYPDRDIDIRRAFIKLNSDARSQFEYVDHFHQHVLAYRVDGCQDYRMAHLKQEALEAVGMFATNKKFGDITQPGAFSNLSDFEDDSLPIDIHRGYAQWILATCGGAAQVNRPSKGIESYQVYNFLKLCEKQKIDYTENNYQYIRDVVAALDLAYPNGFTPEELHRRAKASHDRYWTATTGTPQHGVDYDRKTCDICFLLAQLKHWMPNQPTPIPGQVYGKWVVPLSDV